MANNDNPDLPSDKGLPVPNLPSGLNASVKEFLIVGISVFAAVAVVVSYGIDPQTALPNVLLIVLCGIAALALGWAIRDARIQVVLKWFVVSILILWVLAFIASRIWPGPRLDCISYPLSGCRSTSDHFAETNNTSPPVVDKQLPAPKGMNPADFKVFMQFAGTLRRSDIQTVLTDLQQAGWNVQDANEGGERTPAAAGFAEIRYGADADGDAAKALAAAIDQTKLVNKTLTIRKVPVIPARQLEIYVSN